MFWSSNLAVFLPCLRLLSQWIIVSYLLYNCEIQFVHLHVKLDLSFWVCLENLSLNIRFIRASLHDHLCKPGILYPDYDHRLSVFVSWQPVPFKFKRQQFHKVFFRRFFISLVCFFFRSREWRSSYTLAITILVQWYCGYTTFKGCFFCENFSIFSSEQHWLEKYFSFPLSSIYPPLV